MSASTRGLELWFFSLCGILWEIFVLLNSPGDTALPCRNVTHFPVNAADLICFTMNSVIRLSFFYREQEHVTGTSYVPGNQLKYRALDICTGSGPWYAETYINSILFLLSTVGKRLDLEVRLQRARIVLMNYRYGQLISFSSLTIVWKVLITT